MPRLKLYFIILCWVLASLFLSKSVELPSAKSFVYVSRQRIQSSTLSWSDQKSYTTVNRHYWTRVFALKNHEYQLKLLYPFFPSTFHLTRHIRFVTELTAQFNQNWNELGSNRKFEKWMGGLAINMVMWRICFMQTRSIFISFIADDNSLSILWYNNFIWIIGTVCILSNSICPTCPNIEFFTLGLPNRASQKTAHPISNGLEPFCLKRETTIYCIQCTLMVWIWMLLFCWIGC